MTRHNDNPKRPPRIALRDMSIDWEDLPSLSHLLAEVDSLYSTAPVWLDTMPSEFDGLAPSDPFREALPGLAIREVTEPDIFRLFFGVVG